jgi:hypothetical protein
MPEAPEGRSVKSGRRNAGPDPPPANAPGVQMGALRDLQDRGRAAAKDPSTRVARKDRIARNVGRNAGPDQRPDRDARQDRCAPEDLQRAGRMTAGRMTTGRYPSARDADHLLPAVMNVLRARRDPPDLTKRAPHPHSAAEGRKERKPPKEGRGPETGHATVPPNG